MTFLPGPRLALDVGKARVGVARSDSSSIMALPVATVLIDKYGEHLAQIADYASTYQVVEIVIGLPLHLNGTAGQSAQMAKKFAADLRKYLPGIPLRFEDERLTSVTAHRQLDEAGWTRRAQRDAVDQAAAVLILEQTLERMRRETNNSSPRPAAGDLHE